MKPSFDQVKWRWRGNVNLGSEPIHFWEKTAFRGFNGCARILLKRRLKAIECPTHILVVEYIRNAGLIESKTFRCIKPSSRRKHYSFIFMGKGFKQPLTKYLSQSSKWEIGQRYKMHHPVSGKELLELNSFFYHKVSAASHISNDLIEIFLLHIKCCFCRNLSQT